MIKLAYKGINIEIALRAVKDDYTAIGSVMTHGGQDGYRIVDYILRILKAHQEKAISNRKKQSGMKRTQSAANTLDSVN